LSQTNLQSPPEIPSDPTPADGAAMANLEVEFLWTCSDLDGDPLTYDIYLDTLDTPAIYDSLIDTTTYTAARIYYNTTYYWQVVAKDTTGLETEGPVWSFVIGDDETSPSVAVTAPNTGNLWYIGLEYDITWEASDDDSIDYCALEISIDAETTDAETTWISIEDSIDGNPQTYAWTVPDTVSDSLSTVSLNCLMRVSCYDFGGNTMSDVSDMVFTIWPSGGMIAFTSNRDGDYDIFTMFADGTNQQNLINSYGDDFDADWSPDCSKIVFRTNRDNPSYNEIYVMNRDGSGQTNISNRLTYNDAFPVWSPLGDKIAFASIRDGTDWDIMVMDIDGQSQNPLTSHSAHDYGPNWSPSGEQLAFHSYRDGNYNIYVIDADGMGTTMRLTTHAAHDYHPAWSPDGTLIAFSSGRDGNYEIYLMNANGSNQHRITNNSAPEWKPRWSPDPYNPKSLFHSDRSGDYEIWIMDIDGSNLENLSNDLSYDAYPSWSPIY